jgi:hypothetical protein
MRVVRVRARPRPRVNAIVPVMQSCLTSLSACDHFPRSFASGAALRGHCTPRVATPRQLAADWQRDSDPRQDRAGLKVIEVSRPDSVRRVRAALRRLAPRHGPSRRTVRRRAASGEEEQRELRPPERTARRRVQTHPRRMAGPAAADRMAATPSNSATAADGRGRAAALLLQPSAVQKRRLQP